VLFQGAGERLCVTTAIGRAGHGFTGRVFFVDLGVGNARPFDVARHLGEQSGCQHACGIGAAFTVAAPGGDRFGDALGCAGVDVELETERAHDGSPSGPRRVAMLNQLRDGCVNRLAMMRRWCVDLSEHAREKRCGARAWAAPLHVTQTGEPLLATGRERRHDRASEATDVFRVVPTC